jgi:hypothetical protein
MKRKFGKFRVGLLVAGLALAAAQASAAVITYVDATAGAGGNTTLTDGSQWNPLAAQSFVSNDGVWEGRAFGNSSTIYQNTASGTSDDAHRLLTTMSGLKPGALHNVYAYFWSDTSGWRIQAATSEAGLTLYTPDPAGGHGGSPPAGVTLLGPTGGANPVPDPLSVTGPFIPGGAGANPGWTTDITFTSSVQIANANRRLYQAYLGTANADGSGNLAVYIDDGPATDQNSRTWYDGVGYELVPEPTSLALLGLGWGVLLIGRRNSRATTGQV